MEVVVSGTRPTGVLHLGNYYGAVRNYVLMQDSFEECYFFIADYHSLTTHPKSGELQKLVKETVAAYLASGLDPEKVHIYVQSDLPQIAELYLLLNMLAYKGELEKVATFKEKIKKHKQNINAGLLTYPVLMAADILIHRASKVPVGKDQEQHLEMTRNFAKRFNHLYGEEFFPLPVAYNFGKELIKVPGLQGAGKMSKSDNPNSAILLNDPPEVIRKKIMRAKTDAGPTEPGQEMSGEVKNLFTLMEIVSEAGVREHFSEQYRQCKIRYGELKKQLAEDMIAYIDPIREKLIYFYNNEGLMKDILARGAEKAVKSADNTIRDVRHLMGLQY